MSRDVTICALCGLPSDPDCEDDVIPFTPRASNPDRDTFWIHWDEDADWSVGIGSMYDDPNWVETMRNRPERRCSGQYPSPDVVVLGGRSTKVANLKFYSETKRED